MSNSTEPQGEERTELAKALLLLPDGKNLGMKWDMEVLLDFIQSEIDKVRAETVEDTSDGYHTFKELYEFRLLYNAALFNEWASQGKYNVHKSLRHSSGERPFGGGWFVVSALLPTGQITNHYELKDWSLFQVPEQVMADEWNGHTAIDVATRLRNTITKPKVAA